jgi:hypothetical protein
MRRTFGPIGLMFTACMATVIAPGRPGALDVIRCPVPSFWLIRHSVE